MLKIAQLTDLHLSENITREGNWHDTKAKFDACLQDALQDDPDLFVITGDVLNDQSDSYLYPWFFDKMAGTGKPYRIIAGNHDEGDMLGRMADKPTQGERILPWAEHKPEAHLLFIDTADATIHTDDMQWLKKLLTTANRPVMLFMHHPPVKGYAAFMDGRYGLKGLKEMQQLLAQCPQPVHIFCGHYHMEKTVLQKSFNTYFTPATYYQISDLNPEYEVVEKRGGWRMIWLDESGTLTTRCRYV